MMFEHGAYPGADLHVRLRIAEQIPDQAHVIPNYSFQVRKFAGPGNMCIGDSHRELRPCRKCKGVRVAVAGCGDDQHVTLPGIRNRILEGL